MQYCCRNKWDNNKKAYKYIYSDVPFLFHAFFLAAFFLGFGLPATAAPIIEWKIFEASLADFFLTGFAIIVKLDNYAIFVKTE